MRDEKRICEATTYAQTGWCWSNSIVFLDPHHPAPITRWATPLRLRRGLHFSHSAIYSRLHRPACRCERQFLRSFSWSYRQYRSTHEPLRKPPFRCGAWW
jgi:hypothetical protein